jgi:hypothetical protein
MARGWESKSVEEQMDAAQSRRESKPVLSEEELELRQQRDSVELQRRRIQHELEAAAHPRRKAQLEEALAFLDSRLASLR